MIDIVVTNPSDLEFDVFVGCVGYEDRSISALKKVNESGFSGSSHLLDYNSGDTFSYQSNLAHPLVENAKKHSTTSELLQSILHTLKTNGSANIAFDVTSLDRSKIAEIIQFFFRNYQYIENICILYFPIGFTKPNHSLDVVRSFGPVIPGFIGDTSYSRDELTLVIGAGYEYGKAVGAIELLEPDRVYCLKPIGTDKRFEEEVLKNNLEFSFLENPDLLIDYDLQNPANLFYEVRRTVEFELAERNVLILPMGPKIFAAISMIVASILHPSVMVWRHSTVSVDAPKSVSNAFSCGIDIRFSFRFVALS